MNASRWLRGEPSERTYPSRTGMVIFLSNFIRSRQSKRALGKGFVTGDGAVLPRVLPVILDGTLESIEVYARATLVRTVATGSC